VVLWSLRTSGASAALRFLDRPPTRDAEVHAWRRLPVLPARPAVTLPAAGRHRPLTGTNAYCLEDRCTRLRTTCLESLRGRATAAVRARDLTIASRTPPYRYAITPPSHCCRAFEVGIRRRIVHSRELGSAGSRVRRSDILLMRFDLHVLSIFFCIRRLQQTRLESSCCRSGCPSVCACVCT